MAESSTKSAATPKPKKKFPVIIAVACGCLLCIFVAAVTAGIIWFLSKDSKGGPVHNENPLVDIVDPTGSNWYASYEASIKLSGIASDEEGSLDKIEWSLEGGDSGTATGTDSWEVESISLKEGDNKITVTAYDKGGNMGTDEIFVVYNKEVVFVEEPKTNPDNIYKDDPPVNVVVTAKIKAESEKDIGSVKLYKVDEKGEIVKLIGDMKDDGKVSQTGDDIPGDGTFSYKGKFSSKTKDPIYLRVVSKLKGSKTSGMSGVFKIIVVESLSQNAQQQIDNLNQQVTDLQSQLEQQQASQQEIANQINDLVGQQPGIAANGISQQGQGVWWVYENTCIPGGILINPPNTRGGEANPEASLKLFENQSLVGSVKAQGGPKVENTKALYLAPYHTEFGQFDDYYGAWKKVKESKCPECETVEKKDLEVTVEDFKNLDDYGLVLISSHGDNWYGGMWGDNMCLEGLQQSQVIILTNQKLTQQNMKKYEADLMARRLAVHANGNLVILPAFITHYNTSFPNSIVYVATCRSSYNTTLASAFLGRGAQAFFGFDDYVLSSYCFEAGTELFDNFVLQGDTASTSFNDTVSAVGGSDGQGADFLWNGQGSLTMGGKDFGNVSFETGTLDAWIGAGDERIITSLGPIKPKHGDYMAIISTGIGSVSDSKSSIKQSICYGKSGGTLKFDYNLVSEEPMEYLNSKYDDKLDVYVTVKGQTKKILTKGVNNSQWKAVSGIDFDGGDSTTFQTGWKTFSYSLSNVKSGDKLVLKFQVSDVGDSAYDTAALIDRIRID